MTEICPRRYYRSRRTREVSPLLRDMVGDRATVNRNFDCAVRRGTWFGSPFLEIDNVPPMDLVSPERRSFQANDDAGASAMNSYANAESNIYARQVTAIFDAITESVERSWRPDKFHVVFHSSGWDSRIISAAIKRLWQKHGQDWLGPGLIFLSNRWEANETREIILSEGWDETHLATYMDGRAEDHFERSLDFGSFWRTANAPLPLPGNLWWYLVDWAQEKGLVPADDDKLQGYSGLWANETWRWFAQGGLELWLMQYAKVYYYTAMAVYPPKIPLMAYPMSDLEVLKLVTNAGLGGDKLRRTVAEYACPEAKHVPRFGLDDRGHPISKRLRNYCESEYNGSWYGRHVRKNWRCPPTSEYSNEWGWWGLASLCEKLRRERVNVRA